MALVRGTVVLLDTQWNLIYTVPAGNGATLDLEFANLAGTQVEVQIAGQLNDDDSYNVTTSDISRGPVAIPDGSDYNPHHLIYPAGWSIFAKTDTAGVNVSYSGENGA